MHVSIRDEVGIPWSRPRLWSCWRDLPFWQGNVDLREMNNIQRFGWHAVPLSLRFLMNLPRVWIQRRRRRAKDVGFRFLIPTIGPLPVTQTGGFWPNIIPHPPLDANTHPLCQKWSLAASKWSNFVCLSFSEGHHRAPHRHFLDQQCGNHLLLGSTTRVSIPHTKTVQRHWKRVRYNPSAILLRFPTVWSSGCFWFHHFWNIWIGVSLEVWPASRFGQRPHLLFRLDTHLQGLQNVHALFKPKNVQSVPRELNITAM